MSIPTTPGWIAIYILVFGLVWLPIGAHIFRWAMRDFIIDSLKRPVGYGGLTDFEKKITRWIIVPALIIAWPVSLMITGTGRVVSFALDDRSNRIRKLKRNSLPTDIEAIRFMEDLHERTHVPYWELMDFINNIYDKYKDERGWSKK